jgi:hypothetical protein
MFLCYVDESGDAGIFDENKPGATGSPYFILTGLIVHSSHWKQVLDAIKSFRKKLYLQSYLKYDVEFHCSELVDPRRTKDFTQISVPDRWKLIELFADTLGNNKALKVIAVVINKRDTKVRPGEYLLSAITKLYQAFDEFLGENKQRGLVLFDRAHENKITTHVRKLMGTGPTGGSKNEIQINWIIEDPVFRVSHESMFIQAADVLAFTLKEKEFPSGARKKLYADRIFPRHLSAICYNSKAAGDDRIIRL